MPAFTIDFASGFAIRAAAGSRTGPSTAAPTTIASPVQTLLFRLNGAISNAPTQVVADRLRHGIEA